MKAHIVRIPFSMPMTGFEIVKATYSVIDHRNPSFFAQGKRPPAEMQGQGIIISQDVRGGRSSDDKCRILIKPEGRLDYFVDNHKYNVVEVVGGLIGSPMTTDVTVEVQHLVNLLRKVFPV